MDLPPPYVWKAESITEWERTRPVRLQLFRQALGRPHHYEYTPEVRFERDFNRPEFDGKIYLQRSGPDTVQRLLLLTPKNGTGGRRPAVIVPFYIPDRSCGYDLESGERLPYASNRVNLALHLVSQGYVVVCGEAYPRNLVPKPPTAKNIQDFVWWRAAAEVFNTRYPEWTGMGKLYADARLLLDFTAALDSVDPEKIAVMGHSLGGKIAFYLGCLDERIRMTVCSDFGLVWECSNWEDEWYFGKKLEQIKLDQLNHAQLLALAAPRAFLLIGGQYDLEPAGVYLEAARKIYELYGAGDKVDFIMHATGHAPSWDALEQAYRKLAERLELPPPDLSEFFRQKELMLQSVAGN